MAIFSLINKNILITGASSGIGASCCKLLSEQGANIILTGRNSEKLKSTLAGLEAGNHTLLELDLSENASIENALNPVLSKYQKIDGFIHSAGIELTLPFNNLKLNHYQTIFGINVFSGLEIARILSKSKYIPENGSSYIFISSIRGITGAIGAVAYSASKGALISAVRSVALELATKKIRVNCISPAFVKTNMLMKSFSELPIESVDKIVNSHPLGLGKPADIASACLYLLSEESGWVTGSNLIIDGGFTIQ